MSENNLSNKQSTDEVDLNQLFVFIEKIFKGIANALKQLVMFLILVLEKVGIFFLVMINVLKKHILKVAIAFGLTYIIFSFLDKSAEPVYQSNMIIDQNYSTGKLLYNSIARYNTLAEKGDSISLSKELGIPISEASKIAGFNIFDNMNKNQIVEDYYAYIRDIDSTFNITLSAYKEQQDIENYKIQSIHVLSSDPSIYGNLAKPLINVFENNSFYNQEKTQQIENITREIEVYENMLTRSDALQQEYINLLKQYYGSSKEKDDPANTTLNLNLSNNRERINSREFELFQEQQEIRLKIAELKNNLAERKTIVRLQKDFSQAIAVDSVYKKNKLNASLLVGFMVLIFYLMREFKILQFIEKYGDKNRLI